MLPRLLLLKLVVAASVGGDVWNIGRRRRWRRKSLGGNGVEVKVDEAL
jgi:hypothetical protein